MKQGRPVYRSDCQRIPMLLSWFSSLPRLASLPIDIKGFKPLEWSKAKSTETMAFLSLAKEERPPVYGQQALMDYAVKVDPAANVSNDIPRAVVYARALVTVGDIYKGRPEEAEVLNMVNRGLLMKLPFKKQLNATAGELSTDEYARKPKALDLDRFRLSDNLLNSALPGDTVFSLPLRIPSLIGGSPLVFFYRCLHLACECATVDNGDLISLDEYNIELEERMGSLADRMLDPDCSDAQFESHLKDLTEILGTQVIQPRIFSKLPKVIEALDLSCERTSVFESTDDITELGWVIFEFLFRPQFNAEEGRWDLVKRQPEPNVDVCLRKLMEAYISLLRDVVTFDKECEFCDALLQKKSLANQLATIVRDIKMGKHNF